MRVVGTAGHVDHGKSALIEALTGTHPDRLAEEQAREMTIDLGFGWLTLPGGQEIGIVDVPGHRDFVENMLAGVSGIDAALLVIAADEGPMPQTREHLAILDLLRIPAGIIVLTKTDLINDQDWLEAVESEARRAVRDTVLEHSPVVRVSARTGAGLDELVLALEEVLSRQPERRDLERPRLPVDRVFTMSGFGTVVTGTLSDGHLSIGDDIEMQPSGMQGRVRGLQTHRRSLDRAVPGSRTAVNISGIPAEAIRRGQVLTHPGTYQSTRRFDARLRLLSAASTSLLHGREVKVFVGTSETIGRVRLLGTDELAPGQQGWLQVELHEPLVCMREDAFILRRPSPPETIGGGTIVDAQPAERHRRFDAGVLASIESVAAGEPADVLYEAAVAAHAAPVRQIVARSLLAPAPAEVALRELIHEGKLILLEGTEPSAASDFLVMAFPEWSALILAAERILSEYHRNSPLRAGMPREELKSQLNLTSRLFAAALNRLASTNVLIEKGGMVALRGHTIAFDARQQAKVDALMREFEGYPYSPPPLKECREAAGDEIVSALIALGQLVVVSSDVAFRKADYELMVAQIRATLERRGEITLAQIRDQFHTSRRYAQALLEHLDAKGVTRRVGDIRVLGS